MCINPFSETVTRGLARLRGALRSFRDDPRGTVVVETVIMMPVLVLAMAASYQLFDVFRYREVREKAVYTVVDMLSREQAYVTPTYLDNTKRLFDQMTNDNGVNQLRISVVKYDVDTDTFSVSWSQVRGTGTLTPLTDSDVRNAHGAFPIMSDGQEIIVVESDSDYKPVFAVGLGTSLKIDNRIFTALRFAPQLLWSNGGIS